MPRPGHAFVLAALFVFHATLAAAQAPREEQTTAGSAAPAAAPSATESKARADRRAMQSELLANDANVQREVAALEARLKLTDDAATRMLIQRHIEAAKFAASAESFRIQLRHAQAMGRATDAQEIQGVLDALAKQPRAALPALPAIIARPAPAVVSTPAKKEAGK